MENEENKESKWKQLRETLLSDDHEWIVEDELKTALNEAYNKGIDPAIILACRQACGSRDEFRDQLGGILSGPVATRKRRILAIDDEVNFLDLLRLNLEKTRRYEVVTESDPLQAMDTFLRSDPDLVIVDVIMPGLDGQEFVRNMRACEVGRNIPVIMLTALLSDSSVPSTTHDGLLHLAKPMGIKELVHCMEEHLRAAERKARLAGA
jgi:CheY-like chemotaxis protein